MELELSDSNGSSSTDSKTTKRTISAEIVQLGERPIIRTVFKETFLSLPCQMLPALTFMLEFYFVTKYTNSKNTAKLAFIYPFVAILVKDIPNSIAQYAAGQAYKNIGSQQYTAANIYFAYYFFTAVIYSLVLIVLDFAVLKRFYAEDGSHLFFICEFSIIPILHFCTFGVDKFLEVENRLGLVCCKQIMQLAITTGLAPIVYNYYSGFDVKNPATLDHFIIVEMIAYLIEFVWSFFVIIRANVFGVLYFGVLKFNTRRLRPFRPRFLWTLFFRAIPNMMINNTFNLACLVIALILFYVPTTDYDLTILFVANFCVIVVHDLLMSLHRSFGKSLYLTAEYNISIKKLSRAYQFLKMHILFDSIICIPLCLLFILLSRPISTLLLPQVRNLKRDADYEINSTYTGLMIVSGICSLGFLMEVVTLFNDMENNWKMSCLLQLPALLYAVAVPFISLAVIGETAPCSEILGLLEMVNGIVALPFVFSLLRKYEGLEKLEQLKLAQEQKMKEKQIANDEIRSTVTQAFDADVEAEDSHTAQRNSRLMRDVRLSMTAREKSERLTNSMVFQGMARQFDSMDRWGSIANRSTTELYSTRESTQSREFK